jgi:hypothetical protein
MGVNRERSLVVIGRENTFANCAFDREILHLIRRLGIGNVFTDEALHMLALRLIWNRRQHNKFAAASRAVYAAKGDKSSAV